MQYHHVASIADAATFVSYFAPGDVVLVKASRAERFELLADEIQARWLSRDDENK
jgi:UDP-N-acetylmuramoyl-tripeptide--D-alanyl-D-alanine ligase